jgi:hypothetical protein
MHSRGGLGDEHGVDTFVGYDFGDRLSFTVGSSYIVGKCSFEFRIYPRHLSRVVLGLSQVF